MREGYRPEDVEETMKLKLVAGALLGAAGIGALAYSLGGFGAAAAQGPEYLTATASVGDVTADIAATGTLAATSRTAVAFGLDPWIVDDGATAPTSAASFRVTEVPATVGATVKAGDTLAVAESPDLERQLTTAKNELAAARINLRTAEDQVDDAEDAENTAQIRQAKVSRYNALNQVADARARIADIEAQLAAGTLTAPIDGIVTEVNVSAGFDAPAGAAIVIDAPGFQVTTDVVESDLASVEVGQTATVSIDAIDAEVTGTVTAISPLATEGQSVVSYPVTVALDESPADAHAGMSADVTITTATAQDVLTVPTAALLGTEGNYRVRTLASDGTLTAVPVEVGLATDSLAEITSGLTEGTAVVTGTASDLAGTSTTTGGFGVPGGGFGGGGFVPPGGGFGGPGGGGGGGNGGDQP
jgi:macrolide-specific efflux system membrane fusion protein